MAAAILATKLYVPPPPPKAVPRPRLIERLNEGLHRKLVLVSAPAGSGKTTLLSEWIAALTPAPPSYLGTGLPKGEGLFLTPAPPSSLGTGLPEGEGLGVRVAWLSLDEGDNDLSRFLTYFIIALQTVAVKSASGTGRQQPRAGEFGAGLLAALQSAQLPPTELILTALLNEITTLPENFVFVLDDYHLIEAKPVGNALAFLIEHLPPQMHLVIATREDPPLPLPRLRARGQLTELRAADLRFTTAEAKEFLNQAMNLNLSANDVSALEARTEGWITGLQLAALSMQGRDDIASFIQAFTGSHRFVLDYLVEEVLQQQTESIQSFLLRTSILSRLCGSLCDEVTRGAVGSGENADQPASQEILEQLEHANLFLVPLDNERGWYRYHHLFRDILRQRLGQRLSAGEIAESHLRASQWFEKNGDQAEAFQHAVSAGDFGRAAELAESAWEEMNATFQSPAWLGWVKRLPDEEIRQRPVLSAQMGLAFMDVGEPEASEYRLQQAERCLNDASGRMVVVDEAQLKALPAMIAMARAYNAQVQGNFADTVKYAELALQLIPEDDFFRRAQATITLQFTHWASGDLESARAALDDWIDSMQKAGNFAFAVASAFAVADILVEQGQLQAAISLYQQSLQLAAEHGKEVQQITAHHYLGLAMLFHEMGEDAAAAEHLQKAKELGEQTTLVDWPYRWHIAQARLTESAGELEAALALLDQASRVYVKNPIPDTRPIEALKANLYLKQGRLKDALDWTLQRGLSTDDTIRYLNEFEHLILARVLIANHQNNRDNRSIAHEIEMLERMFKTAELQRRTGSVIEILITLSLAYQAQENISQARITLERALELARPEGYVRIFVDKGKPMQLLLEDLRSWIAKLPDSQKHPLRDYVEKLLSFTDSTVEQRPGASRGSSTLIEPLSEREQEVLRLISKGLSNNEISQRLVLAVSTVKGHNQRIFGKLQVQNRTEAVQRARELGLL